MPKQYTLLKGLIALLCAIALAGCIHNDLPYPRIQQNITAIEPEGAAKASLIDSTNLSVTVYLDELTDIEAVSFSNYAVTPGAVSDPDLAQGTYDLSNPMIVTVSRYQEYQWIVRAQQDIQRWFEVAGQIGESVIDAVGRRVVVRVPETADLSSLRLLSARLAPEGISQTVPALEPGLIDLSHPLDVLVTCWGRTQTWTVYAEKTPLKVLTTAVDAWSRVVWAYGEGPADVTNTFRWRQVDSQEWHEVPAGQVTQTQGAFSACIPHLEPLTRYVVQTVSGDDLGNEVEVQTEATRLLPDGSFDQWWLNGKIWCPWDEGGQQFWDTGNTGAATLGQSNVQPTDDTVDGTGRAARLETRFVGVFGIGKLAAGSIYTGSFKQVDGTNGILDFGRPWSQRPTRLRGYYSYKTAPINYASAEYTDLKGRPDSCHIYVALTDWTAPFEIRTNPKNRQLFDPASPSVIAYGELIDGGDTDGYREFVIDLDYRSTSRVPTYLQVTCAASKYGDYFTGGTGALLLVDQFEFDYDY